MAYCRGKPRAWSDNPWLGHRVAKYDEGKKFTFHEPWEDYVAAKVGSEIFAFLRGDSVGVKFGRNRDELIIRYPNDVSSLVWDGRSGWYAVKLGGAIPDDKIRELVDTSYEIAVSKLPKSQRP